MKSLPQRDVQPQRHDVGSQAGSWHGLFVRQKLSMLQKGYSYSFTYYCWYCIETVMIATAFPWPEAYYNVRN